MSPKIAISDAKPESEHINVWKHGADYARDPDPRRSAHTIETSSNAYANNCV